MNLNQLKYFVTVCDCKSVTKASEKLCISQPSLSAVIKQLEDEFGVSLFRRQYRGVTLTEEGEELKRLADGLLLHSDQVERRMVELGKGRRVLRLGVPPMMGAILLPKIYKEYVEKNPTVDVQITEEGRIELSRLLLENRLDAVLLPHNTQFEKGLKNIKVANFEVVCCVSDKNDLAKLKSVSAEQLRGRKVILFKDGFFQTQLIKNWFHSAGVTPDVLLQTDQLSTLINIISSNRAIGFMFKELVKLEDGLVGIPMQMPMNLSCSLVWKGSASSFSAIESFIDYIKGKKID